MLQSKRRSAFTLIELLTVMAIIVLLIGILTPALSGARNRAKKTAVRAQINAMEVGLEAFNSDEDEFPPSNAVLYANDTTNPDPEMAAWEVGDTTTPLQGAQILVDAMVGRDFLGYDPRAPQVGPGGGSGSTYNRWDPGNDRREPYIPVDGVDVTSLNEPPEDAAGVLTVTGIEPTIDGLVVHVFRDKFGWPILYYRAAPAANQNTPIIQTQTGLNVGDGVYDGQDNAMFTSYGSPVPAGTNPHKIFDANQPLLDPGPTGFMTAELPNKFAEFIRSFRSTTYDTTNPTLIVQPRPVRADRFILLSAGKDGIFGNLDDVANFSVLSTER